MNQETKKQILAYNMRRRERESEIYGDGYKEFEVKDYYSLRRILLEVFDLSKNEVEACKSVESLEALALKYDINLWNFDEEEEEEEEEEEDEQDADFYESLYDSNELCWDVYKVIRFYSEKYNKVNTFWDLERKDPRKSCAFRKMEEKDEFIKAMHYLLKREGGINCVYEVVKVNNLLGESYIYVDCEKNITLHTLGKCIDNYLDEDQQPDIRPVIDVLVEIYAGEREVSNDNIEMLTRLPYNSYVYTLPGDDGYYDLDDLTDSQYLSIDLEDSYHTLVVLHECPEIRV